MDASQHRTRLALGLAAGLAGAATLVWLLRKSRKGLRIARLVVYPVKGCKGIPVSSALLEPEGLEHDREFVVVGPAEEGGQGYRFMSQRQLPAMALIEPSMPSEGHVVLRAPGMQELAVAAPSSGARRIPLDVWGDAAEGLDCGDAAAAWLSECLKAPGLRLLRHVGVRRIDETFAKGATRFSDGFPLLLVTEASLAAVEQASGLGLGVLRFRPNIVLEGAAAFAEDGVLGVTCGTGASAVGLRFVKPCSRCEVPAVEPLLGVRGKDPLRAMKAFRSGRQLKDQASAHPDRAHPDFYRDNLGSVFFGQNAVAELPAGGKGHLAVGGIAAWMGV
mmetsp:Transcript_11579/g.31564  ORF Transcript_11579/g.31564 Transcript_11579/m.31564 type:complete len:333 (-) Transcript_11579:238-1236(-)